MAVIFYDTGEHDAGFVGFRVATTIGSDKEYRQAYFSLKQYSYAMAARLAHDLDEKWRAEAEAVLRERKLIQPQPALKPNIVARGFRAAIGIERKIRKGVKTTYFSTNFIIEKAGNGRSTLTFRTTVHGYAKAFELAAMEYRQIHGLTQDEYDELLGRLPCTTVFTDFLYERVKANGHEISVDDVIGKLNIDTPDFNL